ncbi:hypothetical protein CPAV1605_262 [seawater metagenome]|uniref:Uncharacterized protein n=1 Tax=seawater metagenome TaxID=1561972 RepID=A0A5E8CHK4_9ZZZZ
MSKKNIDKLNDYKNKYLKYPTSDIYKSKYLKYRNDNSDIYKSKYLKYPTSDIYKSKYLKYPTSDIYKSKYLKYKKKYLELKAGSAAPITPVMNWGVGIEHEVLIIKNEDLKFTGKIIKDNMGDFENFASQPVIRTDILEDGVEYPAYEVAPYIDNNKIYKFFKTNGIPGQIKVLLTAFSELYSLRGIREQDILKQILKGIHLDGINIEEVNEFVTREWKNQKISTYVKEIKLYQDIYKLSYEAMTGQKIRYPKIGALFPILCPKDSENKFYSDYTGSYHLNLSLPYNQDDLLLQEKEYMGYDNKVNKIVKDFIWQTTSRFNIYERFQYLSGRQALDDILQDLIIKIPELDKLNFEKQVENYLLEIKEYNSTSIHNFMKDSTLELSNLAFFYINRDTPVIMIVLHMEDYFTRLLKIEDNSYRFDDIFKSLEILKSQKDEINDRRKFAFEINDDNTISVYSGNLLNKRIKTQIDEKSGTKYSLPNITRYGDQLVQEIKEELQNEINDKLENTCLFSFDDINLNYNLSKKYSTGYHKKVKTWALAIQWLIPLILSCYSSGDPFSAGDDDKLSELSLRLFIAGYSFINLSNIQKFNLPTGRGILSYQSQSNLVDLSKRDFIYPKSDYTGSSFRVDNRKGFGFGFELRMFDNFDCIHLEPLIEFIFLLADNLADQNIVEIPDNPFNNPVLNQETINILKEGWNTKISQEYKDLINKNLFPTNPLVFPVDITTAYDVTNFIFDYFQTKFINRGTGTGYYSKYLIDRDYVGNSDMPNINKLSWDMPFKDLIWEKNSQITTDILQSIQESKTKHELRTKLKDKLGKNYEGDVDDIIELLKPF